MQSYHVYLLGRTHTKRVNDTPEVRNAVRHADAIIQEGIRLKGTTWRPIIKEPVIFVAMKLWSIYLRGKSKSKKASLDAESFYEIVKSERRKTEGLFIVVDPPYGQLVNEFHKTYNYLLQIVLFLVLMFAILTGLYFLNAFFECLFSFTMYCTPFLARIDYLLAFLISIIALPTIWGVYFVIATIDTRNRAAAEKVEDLLKEGKRNIIVFYGLSHTDLKEHMSKLQKRKNFLATILKSKKDIGQILNEKGIKTEVLKQ